MEHKSIKLNSIFLFVFVTWSLIQDSGLLDYDIV
jgi:hypothetical protein